MVCKRQIKHILINHVHACASRTCTKTENKKAVEWYRLCYERLRLSTVKILMFFIAQVEADRQSNTSCSGLQ